jgi:hypothetical protein
VIENKFEVVRVDSVAGKVHAVISLIFSIPIGIELFKAANGISWVLVYPSELYKSKMSISHGLFI